MTLEAFASKYKLKLKRSQDDDGALLINGKSGQIYEYSDSELRVSFTPGLDKDRRGVAAGMILRQNGDSDGSLSFDPENREQAKLAIKIAGVKVKRQATLAQLANLAKFRKIPSVERQLAL